MAQAFSHPSRGKSWRKRGQAHRRLESSKQAEGPGAPAASPASSKTALRKSSRPQTAVPKSKRPRRHGVGVESACDFLAPFIHFAFAHAAHFWMPTQGRRPPPLGRLQLHAKRAAVSCVSCVPLWPRAFDCTRVGALHEASNDCHLCSSEFPECREKGCHRSACRRPWHCPNQQLSTVHHSMGISVQRSH
jgi:hypothetical protein